MLFTSIASGLATSYKAGKATYDWLTDASLKNDFLAYLSDLETRRVLYEQMQHEDFNGVIPSLSEILRATRSLRASHPSNQQARKLLDSLIKCIQQESDTIRGCNNSPRGQFMAYTALIKIRTEVAHVLAIFCGMLDVDPRTSDLKTFIMDSALVRPR